MAAIFNTSATRILLAALALPVSAGLSAQQPEPANPTPNPTVIVNGRSADGPEIKGVIAARNGNRVKVVTADGTGTIVTVTDTTRIKAGGGLFGGGRGNLTAASLLNGLPVTVKTWQPEAGQPGGEFVARQISFRNGDLKTANMIRNGTAQGFEEQTAATEALRGRMGDIDKYNVKGVTNVHFDTGKAELSSQDKASLCQTATSAQQMDNALMLVIGYTDSTGDDDFNQQLSEKRAARVINYLQQVCGWKPYRMLTPTGMAKADPAASNQTPEGKAQNRRVAVNILVSKSVDGL